MTIYNALGFVLVSATVAVAQRPRWTRDWTVLSAVPLIALVGFLALDRWRIRIAPPDAIDILGIAVFGVLIWLMFSPVGDKLLLPLAWPRYRLHRFDLKLSSTLRPLGRPLWGRAADWRDSSWTNVDVEARNQVVDALLALKPPTPDWVEVRDRYVGLIRDEIETMLRHPDPSEVEALQERTEAILARVDELRLAYGTKPKVLSK